MTIVPPTPCPSTSGKILAVVDKVYVDNGYQLFEDDPDLEVDSRFKEIAEQYALIALTRVYSGCLEVKKHLFVATQDDSESKEVRIRSLFLLLGGELIKVDRVPIGHVCGILGLDHVISRSATISTIQHMLPLVDHASPLPVVLYAIEPNNPRDLPLLRKALKLLMYSDSSVQVRVQESGELVIGTAGNVLLEKCLEDL